MRAIVCLTTIRLCSGCATATNTYFKGPEFYGGVRQDAIGLKHAVMGTQPAEGEEGGVTFEPSGPWSVPVIAVDTVFSACADTLLLPFWAMRALDAKPEEWGPIL